MRPGLTSLGGCGDAVRAITGCPVAGVAHDELFDATPVVEEAHAFFTGHPDYVDLPRKHKIAIGACADRCFAPEINCISLVGVLRDGEPGFGVLVGGGLSSVPRIARDLGVFVRPDEAIPVLRALLDAWREDLRYRVSRVKSRMKFMVDDSAPRGCAPRSSGASATRCRLPAPAARRRVRRPRRRAAQKQEGSTAIGIPVHLGLVGGERLVALGDLLEELGGEARVTRQQNLVLANVPGGEVERRGRRARRARPPARRQPAARGSIACTGEPHCNYSVTETKTRLDALVDALEQRFGDDVAAACACTSTAARTRAGSTGSATSASRGRPRATRRASAARPTTSTCAARSGRARRSRARVPPRPDGELDELVGGLVGGWLERRGGRRGLPVVPRPGRPTTSSASWSGASRRRSRREEAAA